MSAVEVLRMNQLIERVRDTFEAFTIAEVKRHGGIPSILMEDMEFREAVAQLLQHTERACASVSNKEKDNE